LSRIIRLFKNVDALIGEVGTQSPSGGGGVGGDPKAASTSS
jgi:hypothetical protein